MSGPSLTLAGAGLTLDLCQNEKVEAGKQPHDIGGLAQFRLSWKLQSVQLTKHCCRCPCPRSPECGRRVGGVPRSSLKGEETQHDEGEKNTSNTTTKQNPPNRNKHQKPKSPHGQRPIPPHLNVFPLYQGETNAKRQKLTLTNYGPEFSTKVGRHGQHKSGVQRSLSKGPRPTHKTVTKRATASSGESDDRVLCKSCIVCCQPV